MRGKIPQKGNTVISEMLSVIGKKSFRNRFFFFVDKTLIRLNLFTKTLSAMTNSKRT